MPEQVYGLSAADRALLKRTVQIVRAGKGSQRGWRRRRGGNSGASPVAYLCSGTAQGAPDGSGNYMVTLTETFQGDFGSLTEVHAHQSHDHGIQMGDVVDLWLPIESDPETDYFETIGQDSAAEVCHFTLTADLALAATTAGATIITSSGSSTGSITVTDSEAKFSALTGYKGYAVKLGSNWEILYLEGPARFASFVCNDDSGAGTLLISADINTLWGNPPNGKSPASLTGIYVHKLPGEESVVFYEGDEFQAIWDEKEEEWYLFWYSGLRLTVMGTLSGGAVTEANSTFSLYSPQLVNGWRLPTSSPLTVDNQTMPINAPSGATVFARFNITLDANPENCWEGCESGNFLYMLRGVGDYDEATNITQTVGHESETGPAWLALASMFYGLAQGNVTPANTSFTADGLDQLAGIDPGSSATVMNPFGLGIDDNEEVAAVRWWDANSWLLLMCAPISFALGQAQGAVADTDSTFTGDNFTRLWGKAPGSSETINNTFAWNIDDDGTIFVVRFPGSTTWYCLQAQCPA